MQIADKTKNQFLLTRILGQTAVFCPNYIKSFGSSQSEEEVELLTAF